ncbi:hypothetical protein [Bacteroides sp. UBA939]|uniref:hypothetical protein n=1 Tax=Bacteroides sp. UBA939 TaxID=1946092 RepID=UPI0025C2C094|nr:hypothetical protein [Bacteroides sp. UBA939]
MAMNNRHSGTLRTDYEAGQARLDGFQILTSDRHVLLHRLEKSGGTLCPLLENHVLSVLADISRKQLSGYGESFSGAQGTADVARYAEKLRRDIESWSRRLETYILQSLKSGHSDSIAVKTAQKLDDSLKAALPDGNVAKKEDYYRMLRTVTAIQEQADRYTKQAEKSGDTEPALALLLAYLKSYSDITDTFNHRLASLPGIYLREILHAKPKAAEPDHAYVVITSEAEGFTLPTGTAFPAGAESVYKTEKEEYISPMQCVEADAVYPDKEVLYKHPLLQGTEQPFAHGKALYIGWQIESPMLVLEEGKRKVTVLFSLTGNSVLPDSFPADALALQLSSEEGWTERTCRYGIEDGQLVVHFTIGQEEAVPTACTEEIHGMATEYPALRLLTDQPRWASRLSIDNVEIQAEVTGIRNFTLKNELGEADIAQPFQPFGIQGGRGASFLFGSMEMGLKPLQEVRLQGTWKNLPGTEAEFNRLYKEYDTHADLFTVSVGYRQDGRWKRCGEEQRLFRFDADGNMDKAEISFISNEKEDSNEYGDHCDKEGLFRVTLESPAIGFGMEAYRKRFMEVMINNSRRKRFMEVLMHNICCKKKELKEIPQEPSEPLLADVELSYIAKADWKDPTIRLSRITGWSAQEPQAVDKGEIQPFLLPAPAEHLVLFAFTRAAGEGKVRMYIDTALPKERIPFGSPQPGQNVKADWELWNGTGWQTISHESVQAEETCGLTQSGFIEITLPEKINNNYTDRQGCLWLRAALTGNVSACLAIRGIWMNCIQVTAVDGDGTPLPAGTLQELEEIDERIESITQPLPGFGGRTAETETQHAVRQQMRLHNRHRAVTMKDYEELVLEHFPEVDKAQCIAIPQENTPSDIHIVVFSRMEDSRYFLSPAWKLEEIQRTVSRYTSPFVLLKVVNPQYDKITVNCKVVLRDKVQDKSKVLRQLVVLAQECISPWYRKKEIPDSGRSFSYKELHTWMANHEDLLRLVSLEVGGISLPNVDVETEDYVFKGSKPWSTLLPEIRIGLLSPSDGIEEAEIGKNFMIKIAYE